VAQFDQLLTERIARLILVHPTFGYRRLWALLRFGEGVRVNRKAVYRVLRPQGLVRASALGDAPAAGAGINQPRRTQLSALS
jgi:putative transposase